MVHVCAYVEAMRSSLFFGAIVQFDAEVVRAMGEIETVIAIFVGTLPKTAQGH
jgi:hypothetical protein